MENVRRTGVIFSTRHCAVLDREVRVVLHQQPDGTWMPVRCLDKSQACLKHARCPIIVNESRSDAILML